MSSRERSPAPTDGGAALVPERRFPEFHEAGAWESVVLGSVASIRSKKVGDKKCVPMSITSGVGLVSQMEKFGRIIAGDSYKNYLQLQKSDFAYNKSATKEYPEGFISLYTGGELAAVPNSIFTCFRVQEDAISPSYLNYLFLGNLHGRWLRKFIEVGARAHGSLSINDRDLLALPVPIPSGPNSLKEQQQIAECLKSADALIVAQGRKVEALRAHKRGLMQQLFPQEGETEPRLRLPEFEGAGVWQEATLSEYFDPIRNGFVGTATPYYTTNEGVRYLQGKNIKQGRIEAENLVFITKDFHNRQRKSHLKPDDIIMVQSGHVGECAVVGPEFAGSNCHALIILTPKRTLCPDFFRYYFYSPIGELAIFQITTGNTIKHILASELKTLSVIVPDLLEQQRIADCLNSLDDLITAETRKLDTLKTHKKGLMQQLFPQVGEAGV